MSETSFNCIKCGKLLLKLAKGSSYHPRFRAVCSGCVEPQKSGKNLADDFKNIFKDLGDMAEKSRN